METNPNKLAKKLLELTNFQKNRIVGGYKSIIDPYCEYTFYADLQVFGDFEIFFNECAVLDECQSSGEYFLAALPFNEESLDVTVFETFSLSSRISLYESPFYDLLYHYFSKTDLGFKIEPPPVCTFTDYLFRPYLCNLCCAEEGEGIEVTAKFDFPINKLPNFYNAFLKIFDEFSKYTVRKTYLYPSCEEERIHLQNPMIYGTLV